jgi:ubiquinone/menaquinone biosynthesis C-methylase UbiE
MYLDDMAQIDRYTHGHHESVLRSHTWRTAQNSAGFLLPHLETGDRLLDVGCGPGTITMDLAEWVAPGEVIGLDRSPEVIERAREAAEARELSNLSFEVGDVYNLEFEDSSFDVVYAHQVLQHLSDPIRALGEMRRVLVPGGLVAVRDADYGKFTWSPSDPRLDRWMALYHDITKRNGAEADAGRYLVGWVRDAGFDNWTASTSQWLFRTDEERAWWGGLWAERVQKSEFARQGLEFELTTPEELNEISAAFLEWSESPEAEFVVTHDEVLARKRL